MLIKVAKKFSNNKKGSQFSPGAFSDYATIQPNALEARLLRLGLLAVHSILQ